MALSISSRTIGKITIYILFSLYFSTTCLAKKPISPPIVNDILIPGLDKAYELIWDVQGKNSNSGWSVQYPLLLKVAERYQRLGKKEKAHSILLESSEIVPAGYVSNNPFANVASTLAFKDIAKTGARLGFHNDAIAILKKVTLNKQELLVEIHNEIASQLLKSEKVQQANLHLDKSTGYLESISKNSKIIKSAQTGSLLVKAGKETEGINLLNKASQMAKEENNQQALFLIAKYYYDIGKTQKSKNLAQNIIATPKNKKITNAKAKILAAISSRYLSSKPNEIAVNSLTNALDITMRLEKTYERQPINVFNTFLGEAKSNKADIDNIIDVSMASIGNLPPYYRAQILWEIIIFTPVEKVNTIEKVLTQIKAITKDIEHKGNKIGLLKNIANVHIKLNQKENAEKILNQTLALSEKNQKGYGKVSTLTELADLYYQIGNQNKFDSLLKQMTVEAENLVPFSSYFDTKNKALGSIVATYALRDKAKSAVEVITLMDDTFEKASALALVAKAFINMGNNNNTLSLEKYIKDPEKKISFYVMMADVFLDNVQIKTF